MAIFGKIKKKKNNYNDDINISSGQYSAISPNDKRINMYFQKTDNLMKELTEQRDAIKAVEYIVNNTPDGKMALNVFLRLANQGIQVSWSDRATGNDVTSNYQTESDEFYARVGKNNASGLDGLLDQLHLSAITRTGMAVEAVVNKDITDIDELVIVDPATFQEFIWDDKKNRYSIYQKRADNKKIDLYDGNFFYVPHQPMVGKPKGTLHFQPAIVTITQFYTLIYDSLEILYRIGSPRYKASIDRASFFESKMNQGKTEGETTKEFAALLQKTANDLSHTHLGSDFVSSNDISIDVLGGNIGMDTRAWYEIFDYLIPNSFQLAPMMLGRLSNGSSSYGFGSVQYKQTTDTVDSMRRGSKRIIEDISNLWARVRGYNIKCKVTHNPIDWEKNMDKIEYDLKHFEYLAKQAEYEMINPDEMAQELGKKKAFGDFQSKGLYQYLKNQIDSIGSQDSIGNQDPINNQEKEGENIDA